MNTTKKELKRKIWEILSARTKSAAPMQNHIYLVEKLINQQVLQALEEVKSKYQVVIPETFPTSERQSIEAVPLLAIEKIEEKYK